MNPALVQQYNDIYVAGYLQMIVIIILASNEGTGFETETPVKNTAFFEYFR
jgi:hypothetical protein